MQDIVRQGDRNTCRLEYDRNNSELAYFTFANIEETGIVEHCFTTRAGGVSTGDTASLNLSYSRGDQTQNVDENFRRVAAHFGKQPNDIVCSQQTHTTNVCKVTVADKGKGVVQMLMEGLDCYVPLVDDHGVDCVIKRGMVHT